MGEIARMLRDDSGLELCRYQHNQGKVPLANTQWVKDWLSRNDPAPLFDAPMADIPRLTFDWSAGSVGAPTTPVEIEQALAAAGARVGIGRYLENRAVYTAPQFSDLESGPRRTVHLGVDLFVPPGTEIHSPYEAVIHAYADNDRPQDYGPVVILEHRTHDGVPFYSLYGHLSRASLEDLAPGRPVPARSVFATVGDTGENGGWAPHVHVQLLVDLFRFGTDIPGVVAAPDVQLWSQISPDPNLLLRIPGGAAAQEG